MVRLKYYFETMQLDDWTVAVPVGDGASKFHGVVKLSETALLIFELLKKGTSFDEIIEEMAKQFNAPRDVLAADVNRFIADLTEKGLLDYEDNH